MIIFKFIFLFLIFGVIVWIDLPENLQIKLNLGNKKIDYKLNPLSVDTNLFGLRIKKEFRTHLGLDLKGGSHLVFDTDTKNLKQEDVEEALTSVRDIIERRINLFGVSEPTVQLLKSQGKQRIAVDLPGIEKVSEAISLIGQTAQLSFKEESTSEAKTATDTPFFLRLTQETGLTGKHVKKAGVVFDPNSGKPQVSLEFSTEGGKIFAEVTGRNINKPVGIYVDKLLISAPTVQQVITEGNAVITGSFTIEEAKQLAIAINSGALPVPINLVEQRNIGPTLGKTEVEKSVFAGGVGLAMVLLFMILYYGKMGVIASTALVI